VGKVLAEDQRVRMQSWTRTLLAWSLWLATLGCCAAGLVVTRAVVRPLTAGVLVEGAAGALLMLCTKHHASGVRPDRRGGGEAALAAGPGPPSA
jgi:hypothetical protein